MEYQLDVKDWIRRTKKLSKKYNNKKDSIAFLVSIGIMTPKGNLKRAWRPLLNIDELWGRKKRSTLKGKG